MVNHVQVSKLSAGALAKAKKAGRVFNGLVYGSKAAADQARASKSGGGQKKTVSTKKETTVVVIELRDATAAAAKEFMYSVVLNGGEQHADLKALASRKPVVIGARWEVSFNLSKEAGRWAVATVSSLSAGRKTPQQVATVEGSKAFDSIAWVDKWVAVTGVNRLASPEDDSGNTLVEKNDVRIAVISVEMTDDVDVSIRLHVTVELEKAGTGVHTL